MHIGLEFSWKVLLEVTTCSPLLKAESAFKLLWVVLLKSEYLQGWIPALSGQPVPVCWYSHRGIFLCIHSEISLLQPDCCLFLVHLWEESGFIFPVNPVRQLKAETGFPLSHLSSRLNKPRCPSFFLRVVFLVP